MRPYLLFIAMLIGGLIITAVIGGTMDARLIDQEQRRGQAHRAD